MLVVSRWNNYVALHRREAPEQRLNLSVGLRMTHNLFNSGPVLAYLSPLM